MSDSYDNEEDASRGSRGIELGAALVIGLVLGGFFGRWTAPIPEPTAGAGQRTEQTAVKAPDDRSGPGVGAISGLIGQAEEFMGSEQGQGFTAAREIISNASVSDLLDWGRSPENVTRRIINEMSDDELISTITSVTKIDPEDLQEVGDLRDYANRLSRIALSGVITPDIATEFDGVEVDVVFATDASSSRGAEDPSAQFPDDTRKIYAVIPNVGDVGTEVMVHWYQIDPPRNMLFDQYRVSPGDEYSYVWLKSPDGRWSEGEYRVEFFSADEFLTPIASGTYRVVAN